MTPAELAALLDVMAHALRSMATVQPQGVSPATAAAPQQTINDWLPVYQQLIADRGYKAQTLKNHRASLAHVRRLWGEVPIRGLRPHAVSARLKELLPARSSTARRVLAELRDIYAEAIANDWADTNPAAAVKMPSHKIKRARLTYPTWQGMRALAQASPQRWVESMLLLALTTGQRRADLAKMRFSDIVTDADGQQHLRVEQQKQAGKGYGARVEIPLALRLDAIGMTLGDVVEHCRQSAAPGPTLLRKAGAGASKNRRCRPGSRNTSAPCWETTPIARMSGPACTRCGRCARACTATRA